MFRDRGVGQQTGCGGNIELVLQTARGTSPIKIEIDPSEISPAMRKQIVQRARRWLDTIDPPLRLVSGEIAPDQSPPPRPR